ncbi:Putative mitochondrial protein [Durusdinium trenchii]|uniref:Mitochondrial protein n=1 Tax=Durusdinium trenchii TaxID=1381693 RepID=A0ABP0KWG1_9DINO
MPAHEGGACLASSERLFLKPSEELLPPVLERPTTRKAAEPRIRGKDYYKRKREARKERKHPAKHEAERTRQRRHSWDDQYNNWHEDEEEEAPEVHDSGSEPNETDEERSDSELNLFSAPPNASFGEPHVVEERDGWKRIVVNLDTGAAATAIPSDLSLEGHAKTPPQDISYKTASAESCPSRDGRQWELKDFGRPAKVAKHHHIALRARGGLLIPKDSKAGKEYSAFMEKLYKKHGRMTPVRMHNGIYLMDFWIAPRSKEGSDSFGGPPNRDAPAASAGAPDEESGEEVGEEQAQVIVKRSPADPTAQEEKRSDSESDGILPRLIVKCHKTGRYWANVVPSKGADLFSVVWLKACLNETGFNELVLKSDNEPAILALKGKVKEESKLKIHMVEARVEDHQASGYIEAREPGEVRVDLSQALNSLVYDANTGAELDLEKVAAARKEELDWVQRQCDQEEGKVRLLLKSMYGTRDAAYIWQQSYTDVLNRAGFKRSAAWPAIFFHEKLEARLLVHGDDFVILGDDAAQQHVEKALREAYDLRVDGSIGVGEAKQEFCILNRLVRFDERCSTL